MTFRGGKYAYAMGDEGPLADWWIYEDRAIPAHPARACARVRARGRAGRAR